MCSMMRMSRPRRVRWTGRAMSLGSSGVARSQPSALIPFATAHSAAAPLNPGAPHEPVIGVVARPGTEEQDVARLHRGCPPWRTPRRASPA